MHLSVVAVGRNDNYGGDFKDRLQMFVQWTHNQLTLNKISSEIIFVNYNPVDDIPINEFISWPKSNEFVKVKIITVSNAEHLEFVKSKNVKNVPVLEYLAKNVGIRRANGEFILAMNPDILISENLFSKLKKLNKDSYYRANRVDYNKKLELNLDEKLSFQLSSSATQVWFKGEQRQINGFETREYKKLWRKQDQQNFWRRNTPKLEPILNYFSKPVYYHNIEYKFHCNASGDFMLMHRGSWHKLNAYHQNAFISLHVDSLMVIQAGYSGLKEVVFEAPIFHLEHERRYDAINKSNPDQDKAYVEFKNLVDEMTSRQSPVLIGPEDWGLKSAELEVMEL